MREKSRGRPVQEGRQKPREGGGDRASWSFSLSRRGEKWMRLSIASYVFARPAGISRASERGPAKEGKRASTPATPVKIRFTRLTQANTRVLRGTEFGGAAKRCGKMRAKRWRRFLRTLRRTERRGEREEGREGRRETNESKTIGESRRFPHRDSGVSRMAKSHDSRAVCMYVRSRTREGNEERKNGR